MNKLHNHTRALYQRDQTREDERAHAIYKTAMGDYCREDAPHKIRTYDDACNWAAEHFSAVADSNARRAVTGFAIEWW